LSQSSNPHKLSISFSDHTDTIGTEALDSWISTFTVQHDETDYCVDRLTSRNLQLASSTETLGDSNSFQSESRLRLPGSDSGGFGLSIVDTPTLSKTCSSASDLHAALCSNPPTVPSLPMLYPGSVCIEVPEACDSPKETGAEEKTEHIYSVDRLADQEPQGPLRDQKYPIPDAREGPETTLQVSQPWNSSTEVSEQGQPNERRQSIVSATQSRRDREVVVRARKIKELQRARQKIDAVMKQEQVSRPSTAVSTDDNKSMDFPTPPDSTQQSLPLRLSAQPNPGDAPLTSPMNLQVSPVMLVAEQIPTHRSKQVNKPPQLVLRGRTSQPIAFAVRMGDSEISSPSEGHVSNLPEESTLGVGDGPLEKTGQSPTTSATKGKTAPLAPPGVPPKSLARAASATSATSNQKHLSNPLLTTLLPVINVPQAVTATITGNQRSSICSSHTSTSKEARLEARLEALERENRLLEAALMAVLKTGGTLNRCPCVLLSRRQDAVGLRSRRESRQTPGGSGKGDKVDGCAYHGEERRGSVESHGSGVSGVGALDVYLETRVR
jgi:hypothetical protein